MGYPIKNRNLIFLWKTKLLFFHRKLNRNRFRDIFVKFQEESKYRIIELFSIESCYLKRKRKQKYFRLSGILFLKQKKYFQQSKKT